MHKINIRIKGNGFLRIAKGCSVCGLDLGDVMKVFQAFKTGRIRVCKTKASKT